MRAGLWELTTTVNGEPGGLTHNTCFTSGLLELTNSSAKAMRESMEKVVAKGGHCFLKDFKMDGNAISTSTVCGATSVKTSSTYSATAFDTVNTSTKAGVTTVAHIKGRFLGACK